MRRRRSHKARVPAIRRWSPCISGPKVRAKTAKTKVYEYLWDHAMPGPDAAAFRRIPHFGSSLRAEHSVHVRPSVHPGRPENRRRQCPPTGRILPRREIRTEKVFLPGQPSAMSRKIMEVGDKMEHHPGRGQSREVCVFQELPLKGSARNNKLRRRALSTPLAEPLFVGRAFLPARRLSSRLLRDSLAHFTSSQATTLHPLSIALFFPVRVAHHPTFGVRHAPVRAATLCPLARSASPA
jgi:hypothetical protein